MRPVVGAIVLYSGPQWTVTNGNTMVHEKHLVHEKHSGKPAGCAADHVREMKAKVFSTSNVISY